MVIRYPGSKAKLVSQFFKHLPEELCMELLRAYSPLNCYCEPFIGSGAFAKKILLYIADNRTTVIINDTDPGIYNLWRAIRDDPTRLIQMVTTFEPNADSFYRFKAEDGKPDIEPVRQGFQKLALHQISFSGLGFMAGGPLGGREQRSVYDPGCRWKRVRLVKEIKQWHKLMHCFRKFEILNKDFSDVLRMVPKGGLCYLDPPYYEKGCELYKFSFGEEDHRRLAEQLRVSKFRWILSYDDHHVIRQLYDFAPYIGGFEMTPTVQTSKPNIKRRKNREIVIRNF